MTFFTSLRSKEFDDPEVAWSYLFSEVFTRNYPIEFTCKDSSGSSTYSWYPPWSPEKRRVELKRIVDSCRTHITINRIPREKQKRLEEQNKQMQEAFKNFQHQKDLPRRNSKVVAVEVRPELFEDQRLSLSSDDAYLLVLGATLVLSVLLRKNIFYHFMNTICKRSPPGLC